MKKTINVIGAGLAGCEAAWQIAKRGIKVRLYEMKPVKYSSAHSAEGLAELVCSNSFKAKNIDNGSGLLKEEMRRMGSLILEAADASAVPAGGALAVDRDVFSGIITKKLVENECVEIIRGEVKSITDLPEADALIIATGPLTSDSLAKEISEITGNDGLSFYDAAAPVVMFDSIDQSKVFRAARYGKGSADYINCPMTKEEYLAFYEALIHAETADVEGFDDLKLYEGCMPVESMAKRGVDTLRFGPLKPVGLELPAGGIAYAVVQLRQDNTEGTLYNLVGFQTRLKFGEQKRVFGMIPGLKNAEYARYGVMHRNTYIKSPGLLDETYRFIPSEKNIYFAGQITGVEGYIESSSSGLVAGINAAMKVLGKAAVIFPQSTMIGALAHYASGYAGKDFQPMGANFGIVTSDAPELKKKIKDKSMRKMIAAQRALEITDELSKR
ncbi:MAG: methylenetetrahydrofolate--tRNA-(uracil(54)-C(5))-methyltransferase (FADH(2)-oxidizing) TrmFO [Ruminococcaceae bacterium]|nr:methylenetetrahydrofolate--tRNA-(uracil(54)-C(5))-methyltransferase (FADH(2)-oxidizing) TrmFO [Oscillospiraceae bacterium]